MIVEHLYYHLEAQPHVVEVVERLCPVVGKHMISAVMPSKDLILSSQYQGLVLRQMGHFVSVVELELNIYMGHIHRHLVPMVQAFWLAGEVEGQLLAYLLIDVDWEVVEMAKVEVQLVEQKCEVVARKAEVQKAVVQMGEDLTANAQEQVHRC